MKARVVARHVSFLRPPDDEDVVYEFYNPFAHVPGKYEWVRILSPTHGAFDAFVVLGASPAEPASVYVVSDEGEAFMAERYPESACIRAGHGQLSLVEMHHGRTVEGVLKADEGPVRRARMRISAKAWQRPKAVPYGGEGEPVWGSKRYTCWGVDLVLDARADGEVAWADAPLDALNGMPAIVTLGSFGRIATRQTITGESR